MKKSLIAKIPYITIATVSEDGMPHNTPVFTACDDKYNFYWGTYLNSQKSKNIRHNKNVFLVIYNSTDLPGEGFGVYIKATAEELTDQREITFAHKQHIFRCVLFLQYVYSKENVGNTLKD